LPAIYNSPQNTVRHDKVEPLENLYNELNLIVTIFYNKYKDLDNEITSKRPGNNKWSLNEIMGHLIDSACNNHQRFVRLQITKELIFPDYARDNAKWLEIQRYNDLPFSDIALLWRQYNVLLGNIIKKVDESNLENYWELNGDKITLKDLMIDYVRHLKDHLQHFEQVLQEVKR
jgi:hypothetical protein